MSATDAPRDVPAAEVAAQRVADVAEDPVRRLELLRSSYAPASGSAHPVHLRYARAALAFMNWQVGRGLLNRSITSDPAVRAGEP